MSFNVKSNPVARLAVCGVPQASTLDHHLVETVDFQDSCRAPLRDAGADDVPLFHAVFAHHPMWIKSLLMARSGLMRCLGFDAPTAAEILRPNHQGPYVVGGTLGVWPIVSLSDAELVAGRDNGHLDSRLSVSKSHDGAGANVVVATICNAHSRFRRAHLRVIAPFHNWGLQHLMRQAMRAGRM